MASRWGDIQARGISLSRLAERATGWLGNRRDPAADPPECPRCEGDGYIDKRRGYCSCAAGRALMRSDLDVASDAAMTPHNTERRWPS